MLVQVSSFEGQHRERYSRPNQQLQHIPSDIPYNSELIELNGNEIEEIKSGNSLDFPNCIRLSLSANRIHSISVAVFSKMVQLENLELSYNRLSSIHYRVFQGVRSLIKLDLSHNQIHHIQNDSFSDLDSLKTLRLDYNLLTILQVNAFHGLSNLFEINLRRNRISRIVPSTFNHVPSLTRLNLASNYISSLYWTIFDGGPPKSLDLSLAGNPLICNTSLCWIKAGLDEGWLDIDAGTQCIDRGSTLLQEVNLKCRQGIKVFQRPWPRSAKICPWPCSP